MIKRILTVMGYIIPVIPLMRCLRDTDRRFYTFIEQPLIGIIVTPISLMFANFATHTAYQWDWSFIQICLEVYLAYQAASFIRDGVNTEQKLNPQMKVFLNWFYSAASYVFFTAGAKLALAKNADELRFAFLLVIFSLLWPIFSQTISTYIWTPLLFSNFPKRTLLAQLFDGNVPTEELLLSGQGNWDAHWISWYRERHYFKQMRYQQVEYWCIKTFFACAIAILMTTIYFMARWNWRHWFN